MSPEEKQNVRERVQIEIREHDRIRARESVRTFFIMIVFVALFIYGFVTYVLGGFV